MIRRIRPSLLLLSLIFCLPVWGQIKVVSQAPTTTFQAGTATAKYPPPLVYAKFVSAAGVGNTATTDHVALWTLTPIPAGTLASNGDRIVISADIGSAANGNNKRWGITVAGTNYSSQSITSSAARGNMFATITRVDATHIHIFLSGSLGLTNIAASGGQNVLVSSLATNALDIAITGSSFTTGAANDALLYSGIAEIKQ